MSIEGEICAYVRGCKKKKLAIGLAATIFGRSQEQVISILQAYGLLDGNGQYIEPVRLTGKEVDMEKRKINYPSFAWSPKRQAKLKELYQAGTPVPEIAANLGTDESTVYKGIAKYDLVCVAHKPVVEAAKPVPVPTEDKSATGSIPDNACIDRSLSAILAPLKELLHFIIDAANHNNDTMAALDELKENQACFELGQQCVKLSAAEKIVKDIISLYPEP